METGLPIAMSDIFQRLVSFQIYPLPVTGDGNHASLIRYNSPLKLSKAGFYRTPEARDDEVRCYRCGVKYHGWTGESPMAVHRVLSPDCPHLLSCTPGHMTAPLLRGAVGRVRRRLFTPPPSPSQPSDDVTDDACIQRSTLDVFSDYQSPGTPGQSDTAEDEDASREFGPMLFESHRLLTFTSATHPKAEEWAAVGFIHMGEGDVVRCVFCRLKLPYDTQHPTQVHQQQSQDCPLVRYIDVGNVPKELEHRVRSKQNTEEEYCTVSKSPFKFPQYQQFRTRCDTYRNWPIKTVESQTPQCLAETGFYYTGYADKVVCFVCGVGLSNWDPEADPWIQHAKQSPHCEFVRQQKGDSFVIDAQEAEIMTECEPAKNSECSSLRSPLRPSLDMSAINAALACQYDVQQIRHAILKIFLSSRGRYPNEALLIGTLRASDVNFSELQRQSEQLHTKNLSIIRQAEQLERKDEALEENQTCLEQERERREREVRELKEKLAQKDNLLAQKDNLLAQKDNLLQSQATVIQSHADNLRITLVEVQDTTNQLSIHERELVRQRREMDRQTEEINRQMAEIRRQAEENRRFRQLFLANNIIDNQNIVNNQQNAEQANNLNANVQAAANPSSSYSQCKVCLEEEARCALFPCRHMCCGTDCAPRFIGGQCPICRNDVQDWKIIYVS